MIRKRGGGTRIEKSANHFDHRDKTGVKFVYDGKRGRNKCIGGVGIQRIVLNMRYIRRGRLLDTLVHKV